MNKQSQKAKFDETADRPKCITRIAVWKECRSPSSLSLSFIRTHSTYRSVAIHSLTPTFLCKWAD